MLICFASWEDRFTEGICRSIEEGEKGPIIIFYYSEYESRTHNARGMVVSFCKSNNVICKDIEVSQAKHKETWNCVFSSIPDLCNNSTDVVVNISTMPRNFIWTLLWVLEANKKQVRYSYDRPESYCEEWLSRDPDLPRFMYKMTGVADLSRKTALLLLVGYDYDKVDIFLRYYEPSRVSIGVQSNEHADNQNADHVKKLQARIASYDTIDEGVEIFELDAFDSKCGQDAVEAAARELDGCNIVASSLGPKLTAISLYNLQKKNDNIALAYAPSREYSEKYSSGLGKNISGDLP